MPSKTGYESDVPPDRNPCLTTLSPRRRLDEELSVERFDGDHRPTEEAATLFFRDLLVRVLGFDTGVPATDPRHELPAHQWDDARATAAREPGCPWSTGRTNSRIGDR